MLRFGRIKTYKALLIPQHVASVAIVAFGLSVSTGQANGVTCGTVTPNGNGGDDFLVSGAITSTCTITTNDTLTVMNGGSIVTSGVGGNAVEATNTPTSIINNGLISASEAGKAAIDNSGTLSSLFNTGSISGLNGAMGISNTGTITLLNNSGGIISSVDEDAIFNSSIGTIGTLDNSGGTIQATGDDKAISNGGTILFLNNTGGVISAIDDDAISTGGTIGLINNTNGLISSGTGSAIELNDVVTSGLITNTGGTITVDSSDNSSLYIGTDVGNLTVIGGTISNTNTADDDGRAVRVDATQTGLLVFQGVTIISHGTGTNQGFAIKMDAGGGGTIAMSLDSATVVRGRIANEDGDNIALTTSANIEGNISFFTGADTLTINGGTITGNVAVGEGNNIIAMNGGMLNGHITMGAGNDTFTYVGGLVNGDINFGNGVNTLNVNGMWEPTGNILTGGSTDLNIGNTGQFILNNDVDLGPGQIEVADNGLLHLQNGDLSGAHYLNHGTTRIGVDRTLTIGVFENSPQGTLVFDTRGVNSLMKTGLIHLSESPGDLSNQVVQVNYLNGTLTIPNSSLILEGGNGAVLPTAPVFDNALLYNFGVQIDPGNSGNIYLILTEVKSIEEVASSPANAQTANVLLKEMEGSDDPVIQQIQQKLNTASSPEEFNQVIQSTQQTVDQGNQVAAVGMTGAMFDLADGQLAMVNTGGGTGVAGGNELKGLHFWTQGFGGWADQGLRKGAPGYEADVRGVALGVDTRNFDKDTVVGLSLGFASTDVSADNANNTRTEVTSYQLMAYGNHELGGDTFLTGMALYGWNDNDQTRFNVGGLPGVNAFGEYSSWVGGLRGSVGHNFTFPASGERATLFMLTPQLFSEYVHFSRDGYTETGAGGVGIIAGDASQTILNLGVSLQAEWTIVTENGGKLKPDIHLSYKYDAIGEGGDTTSTFVAGGSTIAIDAIDPARSVFGIGAGVKFLDTSGWDFIAAYDYTFKDEYEAHSGYIRAAYEF